MLLSAKYVSYQSKECGTKVLAILGVFEVLRSRSGQMPIDLPRALMCTHRCRFRKEPGMQEAMAMGDCHAEQLPVDWQ